MFDKREIISKRIHMQMRVPETLFRLFLQGCDEVMSEKKIKKTKRHLRQN